MNAAERRGDAPEEAWRAWWAAAAALAVGYAIFVGRGGPGPIPFIFLAVAIGAAMVAVLLPTAPRIGTERGLRTLLGFGLAVELALLAVWPLTNPLAQDGPADYLPFWAGLALVAVVAALPIFGIMRGGWIRLTILAALHFALGAWVILIAPDPFIDVWVMQADGARALVEGTNPYLPIYENLHGADSPYYGPGLVVDGELTIGFPYPPLSLLLVLPGELLAGDPRFVHLLALEAAAVAMAVSGRLSRVSTSAALLFLFAPWTFFLVAGAWTEPLVILGVAGVLLAATRAPRLLGVAVGLMIAVKQYLILGLPLALLLLARGGRERWRIGWQSVLVATVLTLPFLAWDPDAFVWSTLGSLAGQIFRPDSLSFLAMLPGDWGPRLSSVGFLLLVPLGGLALWRAPRTAFGFAATLGMLLLVFFAFSRQGSANYHFAVIGILCAAVAVSRIEPEPPARASAPLPA
jgi:heme/copper-type cytochrome/quinol oxidase subunit 4